jgi:hypothetical protein
MPKLWLFATNLTYSHFEHRPLVFNI